MKNSFNSNNPSHARKNSNSHLRLNSQIVDHPQHDTMISNVLSFGMNNGRNTNISSNNNSMIDITQRTKNSD